jgi:3-isopropylmalate/(R)-2-methylmalate dehydratase small subunit
MKLSGNAHVFERDMNTDVIIAGRYVASTDGKVLAKHIFEDLDSTLAGRIQPGDIFVADSNFGCGSSREHAPLAIKGADVSCVIAPSFARIFYRNAINIGLPILECAELYAVTEAGDEIAADLRTGIVTNVTKGLEFQAKPFPDFVLSLIEQGGLMEKVVADLQAQDSE